ncbi:Transcriptional regulatory protein RCO1 [Ceratocystis fimbriata CBS 114723]|uniref:Transcriptional regulatory protein RCO1 n=1 Tax=Ceratocystis fimbriata CBS 114723 TaxID=1035309 RepID=A0A2C5X761_9PEZI|nr:Transcriptional regulatory protein RCO1 [Ceratocystis fimbriata CBS 114723]
MSTRATRSRIASPAQAQGQGTNSSTSRQSETTPKGAASSSDSSRSFLQRWLEPEIQNKASFEEHGLMRCGVLENMAALGTLPKLPPKKRAQQNSKSATPMATTAMGSRGSMATAGSASQDRQSDKQPVRKIILHPPASASKSKRTTDIDYAADGNIGANVEIMASNSSASKPGGRKTTSKDFAPPEDENDDDYRPTVKKPRPGASASGNNNNSSASSNANSATTTSIPRRHAASASASAASPGQLSLSLSTEPKPGLGKDSSATPTATDLIMITPTSTGRKKRAAASVAAAAAAKSASLEAAAETVKALVHKAESQGRHATARTLQAAYNENAGDAEFLSVIDKIYRQRSRQSDASMWAQYERLIGEKRRERRENYLALGDGYDDNDYIESDDDDYNSEVTATSIVGGVQIQRTLHRGVPGSDFNSPVGTHSHGALAFGESVSDSATGAGAQAKSARKRRAGAARDARNSGSSGSGFELGSGSGSTVADHSSLGLDQFQPGWGPRSSTATSARTCSISGPNASNTTITTAANSSGSKKKKSAMGNSSSRNTTITNTITTTISSRKPETSVMLGEPQRHHSSHGRENSDQASSQSQLTPFTRVIKLKSRVSLPSSASPRTPASVKAEKEIADSADEDDDGDNDVSPSSPCPASRAVSGDRASSSDPSKAFANVRSSKPRSLSLSSDSSLSSLSSVDENLLLSEDENTAALQRDHGHNYNEQRPQGQPMMTKNAKLSSSANHRGGSKGTKRRLNKSKGTTTATATNSTSINLSAGSNSAKHRSSSASTLPLSSSHPTTISDFFRRTAQLHQEYKAKLDASSCTAPLNPSSHSSSPLVTSPSQHHASLVEEAEKAKLDSVAELRRACIENTTALTPDTSSSIREATSQAHEASNFRLRPLPPQINQSAPTPIDDTMSNKRRTAPAPGTASTSSTSSLSSVPSTALSLSISSASGARATRSSLKRPHEGDDAALEASPPRPVSHTPSRAVTPSLPPSKKQRMGPRVKLSPKKGSATFAGAPRPSSRSGNDSGLSQDNDDFCSACGASGELLCCDNCVKAFHFGCIDVESDKLPDQWFCWECRITRVPSTLQLSPVRGCFAALEVVLERNNPRAFQLPHHIQTLFEGVKVAADGTYEDVLPLTKKRDRKTEDFTDWYKLRDGDSAVLCKACHQSADTIRPIIPCSKCGLHWHLDCLDEPLTVPPVLKTWNCPLHVEPDALAMLISGPAHRYRRIKNVPVISPMFARGNHNNGVLEIEDDLDELQNEYEQNLQQSRNAGWADPQSFGRTYRLKASAVVKDFIESVTISKRPGTLAEKRLKTMWLEKKLEKRKADEGRSLFQDFSIPEAEAALVIATMAHAPALTVAHASPATPAPKSTEPLAIPASPAPTNSSKTDSDYNPSLASLNSSASGATAAMAKEDVLSLIARQSTNLVAGGGPLSESTKKFLRGAMLQIQLALGDDAPTPPLDPTKSLPPSPIHAHSHVVRFESALSSSRDPMQADGSDSMMTDLPRSEAGRGPTEPATASSEVRAQVHARKAGDDGSFCGTANRQRSGVVIVDDEAMSDDVTAIPEI